MSRTIEFQAWHQASKTMFDWCEFSLNGRNNCIIHVTEGVFTTEKVDDNSVILREYTGLNDSTVTEEYPNGKPIYEGDIVKYWGGVDVVVFYEGQFCIEHEKYDHFDIGNKPTVLGNIYQTPELLK